MVELSKRGRATVARMSSAITRLDASESETSSIPIGLISLERVLRDIRPIGIEEVSLSEASNRVIAEDIRATVALPRFDNSTMDGYAVRSVDAVRGASLKITGEQPAGPVCGLQLGQGCAIRIFTGAPIPEGADAIVMQEEVDRTG